MASFFFLQSNSMYRQRDKGSVLYQLYSSFVGLKVFLVLLEIESINSDSDLCECFCKYAVAKPVVDGFSQT